MFDVDVVGSSPSPFDLFGASRPMPAVPGGPVTGIKKLVKKIVGMAGYQIVRSQPMRREFLKSREIDTVIDVGANVGQFGRELRAQGYEGRIVSFEPIRQVFDILSDTIIGDSDWSAFNAGLSDSRRSAIINVSEKTVFSSLQPLTRVALDYDADAAAMRQEEIALHRLEEYDAEIVGDRLFLKIDTQGHEQKVLLGVGRVLERIQGIQLELPISNLYEGTWSIAEAFVFMRDMGFVPTYFSPVNYHHIHDPVAIVEIDCIFRRFDSRID